MDLLIIENEKPAAEKLKLLLNKIDSSISITGILETVEESVNWLKNNAVPNLILMDIQLDDGISFEIFDVIEVHTPIIFITAYNEYVLQAFKVNSVDYLLKPVQDDALRQALNKFKNFHLNKSGELLQKLYNEIKPNFKSRFLLRVGAHYKSVLVNEINCFYILEHASFMGTADGNNYSMDHSLDQLQKLVDPKLFFRINRNCMVHINAISDIVSYSSSRLKIKLNQKSVSFSEDQLVVSRDKVQSFKKWMDR